MLRRATLASSVFLLTVLTSSWRRSCVRAGMERRMAVPSEFGLRPRSDFMIATSMSCRMDFSHGWITIMRASGTLIFPTCWIGVGVP